MGTGTFNAEYNWWGSNNSPASQIYGNVDYNNWLYMWYTVYVPAGVVSDAFGNKLMKSYTFRFKTGRY